MKIFINGWLHHKNHIAINLMKSCGLTVDDIYDSKNLYDCIISTDKIKIYDNAKKTVCGPHIMFSDINCNLHILNKKVYYNCLSSWNRDLFKKIIKNNIVEPIILPFAVDIEKFQPNKKDGKPVIYFKNVDRSRLYDVLNYLKDDFIIFDYQAKYNEDAFLKAISHAPYCIWIGCHESQGFAFQETLSCDTPIFVINVKSLREEIGSVWENYDSSLDLKATSASYFDDSCGIISYPESWKEDWKKFISRSDYKPREFVIDNLSPNACNQRWINFIKNSI